MDASEECFVGRLAYGTLEEVLCARERYAESEGNRGLRDN